MARERSSNFSLETSGFHTSACWRISPEMVGGELTDVIVSPNPKDLGLSEAFAVEKSLELQERQEDRSDLQGWR